MNNRFWINKFKEKRVLVIVPHQDDELFLCGTVLSAISRVKAEIFVIFATNGDYGNNFRRRFREACKALAEYNIKKENIICLGYGDQWDTEYGHIYNAPYDEVIFSKFGRSHTYGVDFSFIKHGEHSTYTLRNYETDLRDAIVSVNPDIIFCNDLDWHPDHRCVSLLFDRTMGRLLRENRSFRPKVYKGFVYFLGWDGKMDYTQKNLLSTKKPYRTLSNDKRFEFGNPYFSWENRERFPIDYKLVLKEKNILYSAISKYKFSESAKRFYYSCMNSDAVFWERETVNLALDADLKVSSGTGDFLRDFVIADSNNISNAGTMKYDKSVWYADKSDTNPTISYMFENNTVVRKIIFYRDTESFGIEGANLEIRTDDGIAVEESITKFEIRKTIDINCETKKLEILLKNVKVGFSEIELLGEKSRKPFVKIMVAEDFVYHYYVDDVCCKLPIRLYLKDCDEEECILKINGCNSQGTTIENGMICFDELFKRCELIAYLKKEPYIYDRVIIERFASI